VDWFSCKLIGRFWRDSLRCGDAAEGKTYRRLNLNLHRRLIFAAAVLVDYFAFEAAAKRLLPRSPHRNRRGFGVLLSLPLWFCLCWIWMLSPAFSSNAAFSLAASRKIWAILRASSVIDIVSSATSTNERRYLGLGEFRWGVLSQGVQE
jgi:hypothetical protein